MTVTSKVTLNPLIFRAYDIRGIAASDLKPDTAELIGSASGIYFLKNHGPKIVIGHDCRIHSPEIKSAFIHGLLKVGCSVTDIGLATSPMTYFAVCHDNFDYGVEITASHNPKEYNGIKLVGPNAHSICGPDLQEILTIAQNIDNYRKYISTDSGSLNNTNIFPDYLKKIHNVIKLQRHLRIGIDAGNGTAGAFAPEIFRALGCEIHELYCEPDGNFPNHEANPEYAENLRDLQALVREKKLDIGIGFDGDGDRLGVLDENGNHIAADFLIIMLARDLLARHQSAPIVFDIKCSNVLHNEINSLEGEPVMTRTGHSFIESKMKEVGSMLGGEISGHIFLGENYYGFDDGIFAAARILEILSHDSRPLSAHFSDLPKLHNTPEIKAACADEIKFQIMEKIQKHFIKLYDCLTIDGVRIHFDKNSWAVIRCSNTSPCLTMRFEANSQKRLQEIQKIVYNKLQEYAEIDNSWYQL